MPDAENKYAIRYGNRDAEIKFGHIHDDQQISSFAVRSGSDPRHYMSMDATGNREYRKGSTINRCPGAYQVKCGDDVRSGSTDGLPAFYVECVNGDMIFSAKRGRIKFQAENIEFIASGGDNENGNFIVKANQKIELKAANIEINATAVAKFFSSGTCQVVGNAILDIYGGLSSCATGASKSKQSKYVSNSQDRENSVGG